MTNILRMQETSSLTLRGPSPALWNGVMSRLITDPGAEGALLFDDFVNFPALGPTAQVIGKYSTMGTAATTIQQGAECDYSEGEIGTVAMTTQAQDNDEVYLGTGGNTGGFLKFDKAASEGADIYFEARVKKSSIADNGLGIFVGLIDEGEAAAATLTDNTAVVADLNHVGFSVVQADGDALTFVYKASGQAAGAITLDSGLSALTADTWVKLGFRSVRTKKDTQLLEVFVDGVRNSSFLTRTLIEGTTFPDAVELAMLIAGINGAASSAVLSADWWGAAAVLNTGSVV